MGGRYYPKLENSASSPRSHSVDTAFLGRRRMRFSREHNIRLMDDAQFGDTRLETTTICRGFHYRRRRGHNCYHSDDNQEEIDSDTQEKFKSFAGNRCHRGSKRGHSRHHPARSLSEDAHRRRRRVHHAIHRSHRQYRKAHAVEGVFAEEVEHSHENKHRKKRAHRHRAHRHCCESASDKLSKDNQDDIEEETAGADQENEPFATKDNHEKTSTEQFEECLPGVQYRKFLHLAHLQPHYHRHHHHHHASHHASHQRSYFGMGGRGHHHRYQGVSVGLGSSDSFYDYSHRHGKLRFGQGHHLYRKGLNDPQRNLSILHGDCMGMNGRHGRRMASQPHHSAFWNH